MFNCEWKEKKKKNTKLFNLKRFRKTCGLQKQQQAPQLQLQTGSLHFIPLRFVSFRSVCVCVFCFNFFLFCALSPQSFSHFACFVRFFRFLRVASGKRFSIVFPLSCFNFFHFNEICCIIIVVAEACNCINCVWVCAFVCFSGRTISCNRVHLKLYKCLTFRLLSSNNTKQVYTLFCFYSLFSFHCSTALCVHRTCVLFRLPNEAAFQKSSQAFILFRFWIKF